MDITAIKAIVNSSYMSHQEMNAEIFKVLSQDEEIVINILTILEIERREKKQLIIDCNLQLSKADIFIRQTKESKAEEEKQFNKAFMLGEIAAFYEKYRGKVGHYFNR